MPSMALTSRTTTTAASSASTDTANVFDFGAVADDKTDDLPAFLAAVAALKAAGKWNGILLIPSAGYFLDGTFNLYWRLNISARGAIMRFPPNQRGIAFYGPGSGLGDAGLSTMDGGTVFGGMFGSIGAGPWTNPIAVDPTAYGIDVQTAFVRLNDVNVQGCSGHAIAVHDVPGSIADCFRIDNPFTQYNQGFGIAVWGSDGNAGTVIGGSHISNAIGGCADLGFLGSTWLGTIHTRDNGVADPNGGDAPIACCYYQGIGYYVVAGQEGAASTTVPGTNPAVWAQRNCATSKQWTPGQKWATGGSFITNWRNVGNSQALFLGMYAEDGQPPAQFFSPVFIIGGNVRNDVGGSGTYISGVGANGPALAGPAFEVFDGRAGTMRFDGAGITMGGGVAATIDPNVSPYGEAALNFLLDNYYPAAAIVRSNVPPDWHVEPGSFVTQRFHPGPNRDGRFGFVDNAAELFAGEAGKWARVGDEYHFLKCAPGQPIGMKCIVAGPIGSTPNQFVYLPSLSNDIVTA